MKMYIGHFCESAGQGAGLSCLDHAFAVKGWARSLTLASNLVFYDSVKSKNTDSVM